VNDSKARKSANNSKAHKQKKASKATGSKDTSVKAAVAPDAGLAQDWIRVRAYELYISRGGEHGLDQDDWFRAEQEISER
jgi:hypothetical protein